MAQTIAESIWEEGHLKGQAEGELKGELKALRRVLRQLLSDRFGSIPESVLQRIENIDDIDRLSAAVLQVMRIATPEDLQL